MASEGAPSVRIERYAFGDPRFDLLGQLIGVDRFSAFGRMVYVWRVCTRDQKYVLDAPTVNAAMAYPGAAEKLVEAGLAEKVPDGFRIKGTEGRIEWYGSICKSAKLGGEANRAKWDGKRKGEPNGSRTASRTEADREPPGSPTDSRRGAEGEPKGSPPTPTPTPTQPDLDLGTSGNLPVAVRPGKPKSSKRRSKDEIDERVHPVVRRWSERYVEHYGDDYPGSYGRAGTAVRKLPSSYTSERLVQLVDAFWDNPDPWLLNTHGARVEVWVERLPAVANREMGGANDGRVTYGQLDAIERRLREQGE